MSTNEAIIATACYQYHRKKSSYDTFFEIEALIRLTYSCPARQLQAVRLVEQLRYSR